MKMADTAHAQDDRTTLYITDAELIRRMGVPEKIARQAIEVLDRDPRKTGFPQKQLLWGNRRYWPAVKAYLDRTNQVKIDVPATGERHE